MPIATRRGSRRWQLERAGRLRVAAALLHQAKRFPSAGSRCLEVGYGSAGWLPDLLHWGVREANLSGIELDPVRARTAQQLLPAADLQVGNAAGLPWEDETFFARCGVHGVQLDSRFASAAGRRAGGAARHGARGSAALL